MLYCAAPSASTRLTCRPRHVCATYAVCCVLYTCAARATHTGPRAVCVPAAAAVPASGRAPEPRRIRADAGGAAAERLAALRYLAGWTHAGNPSYAFYGNDVMALAAKYQAQIDQVTGS